MFMLTPGAHTCDECRKGRFSAAGSSRCSDCPAGTAKVGNFNKTRGQNVDNFVCIDCVVGFWSIAGVTNCSKCLIGQYQNEIAKSRCKACPKGTFLSETGASASSFCQECPHGTYSSALGVTNIADCNKCAAGKKNAHKGSISSAACSNCEANTKAESVGSFECVNCSLGQLSEKGSSSCQACGAGFYADNPDLGCQPCLEDNYRNGSDVQSWKCRACPNGYEAEPASASCVICPAGRFGFGCQLCPLGFARHSMDKDSTKCSLCTLGTATTVLGSATCQLCPTGWYGKQRGACTSCLAGKFQDEPAKSSCKECDANTYLSEIGKASKADCIKCPSEKSTGTDKGNTAKAACLCKKTEYYQDSDGMCHRCPTGANCSSRNGIALSETFALPGYWRPRSEGEVFSSCAAGYSSLDSEALAKARCCPLNLTSNVSICETLENSTSILNLNDQCLEGYAGPLCLICSKEYAKMGNECVHCPDGTSVSLATIPLLLVSILIFVGHLVFMLCGKKAVTGANEANTYFGQLKIILSFLQIFSSMPSVLNGVPWPTFFLTFTNPLTSLNFDLLGSLSDVSCRLSIRFFDQFLLHMIMPLCLILMVLLAWIVASRCTKKADKEKRSLLKQETSKAAIVLIMLIFPGLATKIFTMFKTVQVHGLNSETHSGYVLAADYEIEAFGSEHMPYIVAAFVFLGIYVLGIPLAIFLILWKNKKHLHNEKSPRHEIVKFALGGLYSQYEHKFWWFEIFLLFNKTMMCGGLVMAAPGTPFQVLLSVLIMLFHLLVVLKLSPYVSQSEDWTSFMSSLTLTLTCICGFALMTDDKKSPSFEREGLAVIMVGISVLCIASQVSITICVDCGLLDKICSTCCKKNEQMRSLKKAQQNEVLLLKNKAKHSIMSLKQSHTAQRRVLRQRLTRGGDSDTKVLPLNNDSETPRVQIWDHWDEGADDSQSLLTQNVGSKVEGTSMVMAESAVAEHHPLEAVVATEEEEEEEKEEQQPTQKRHEDEETARSNSGHKMLALQRMRTIIPSAKFQGSPALQDFQRALSQDHPDWTQIAQLLEQHPEMAQEPIPGAGLSLQLALEKNAPKEIVDTLERLGGSGALQRLQDAIRENPSKWNSVSNMLTEHPEVAKEWVPVVKDRATDSDVSGGYLPLHLALENDPPLNVVEELLRLYPDSGDEPTKILSSTGGSLFLQRKVVEKGNESPLDIAMRCRASADVINLLEARPWDPPENKTRKYGQNMFTGTDVHMVRGLQDKISHTKAHRLLKKRSTTKPTRSRRHKW